MADKNSNDAEPERLELSADEVSLYLEKEEKPARMVLKVSIWKTVARPKKRTEE